MDKQGLLNKISFILQDLKGQHLKLTGDSERIPEIELELFMANARYLLQHLEVLNKVNGNSTEVKARDEILKNILKEHNESVRVQQVIPAVSLAAENQVAKDESLSRAILNDFPFPKLDNFSQVKAGIPFENKQGVFAPELERRAAMLAAQTSAEKEAREREATSRLDRLNRHSEAVKKAFKESLKAMPENTAIQQQSGTSDYPAVDRQSTEPDSSDTSSLKGFSLAELAEPVTLFQHTGQSDADVPAEPEITPVKTAILSATSQLSEEDQQRIAELKARNELRRQKEAKETQESKPLNDKLRHNDQQTLNDLQSGGASGALNDRLRDNGPLTLNTRAFNAIPDINRDQHAKSDPSPDQLKPFLKESQITSQAKVIDMNPGLYSAPTPGSGVATSGSGIGTPGTATLGAGSFFPVSNAEPARQQHFDLNQADLNNQPSARTMNDLLASTRNGSSLMNRLDSLPVKDIRKAVGLNEHLLFIKTLFNGDPKAYDRTLTTIDTLKNSSQAQEFIRNIAVEFKWEHKVAVAELFKNIVNRKFSRS